MHFDLIPLQAVKSISQRNLAIHWQALHGRRGLPQFADFSPGNRAHDPRRACRACQWIARLRWLIDFTA